jgi:hypothetical protein
MFSVWRYRGVPPELWHMSRIQVLFSLRSGLCLWLERSTSGQNQTFRFADIRDRRLLVLLSFVGSVALMEMIREPANPPMMILAMEPQRDPLIGSSIRRAHVQVL